MKQKCYLLILLLLLLCSCGDGLPSLPQSPTPESSQPVEDIPDLSTATALYLDPLVSGGDVWFYSWDSLADIRADDFITMCTVHNYLELPRDFEGVYLPGYQNPPARDVESALAEVFGIQSDYLRTSQFYDAEKGTYALIMGGNSGWSTLATDMEEQGDKLTISVAEECPLDEDSMPANAVKMNDIWVIPLGVLTVQIPDDGAPFRYISYDFTGEIPR